MARAGSIIKKTFIGLVAIFIIIQLFHPAKNVAAGPSPQDITALYPVPDSVQHILQKACYDCHSNTTRYPWYNNIQPVAWWMAHHIDEAKGDLNFSEFGKLTPAKQAKKLSKVTKAIQEGWMPLDSYTWIHKDAILTDAEKNIVIDWSTHLSQQIAAKANN